MARRKSAIRTRQIKPGFWDNEELVEMGCATRLLFAGLWCMADRAGRLEDRPGRIRIKLNIFDMTTAQVDESLQALADAGFITRYYRELPGKSGTIRENCKLLQINAFTEHQHLHPAEAPSEYPAPDEVITGNYRLGPSGPSGTSGITHKRTRAREPERGTVVRNVSTCPELELMAPSEAQVIHLTDKARAIGFTLDQVSDAMGLPLARTNVTSMLNWIEERGKDKQRQKTISDGSEALREIYGDEWRGAR